MNFKQLQCVVEVAKWGSFNKASSVLNVSQSTLSQYVTKMEVDYKIKIFDRTTRSVSLTKLGQEFVSEANDIVSRVVTFEEKYSEANQQLKLKLGLVPSIGYWQLSEMINSLSVELPTIEFCVHERSAKELEQMLINRQLDIIITDGIFDDHATITYQPWVDDHMCLIVSERHRLAGIGRPLTLAEIRDEPFIFAGPETGVHRILQAVFESEGVIPRTVVQCSSVPLVSKMVASDIGVAFFTRNLIGGGVAAGICPLDLALNIAKPLYISYLSRRDCLEEIGQFTRHASSWLSKHLPQLVMAPR